MKIDLLKWLMFGALFVFYSAISVAQQTSLDDYGQLVDGVRDVSALEASLILSTNPEVRVLDVRTEFEYSGGHLANAVNVNYYSLSFRSSLDELDKDVIWLVHCKSGVRSSKTLPIMKELGFKTIIHMTNGINEWRKSGLVEKKG